MRYFDDYPTEKALELINELESECDPDGSYTGVPIEGEYPIQDADDL